VREAKVRIDFIFTDEGEESSRRSIFPRRSNSRLGFEGEDSRFKLAQFPRCTACIYYRCTAALIAQYGC